MPEGTGLKVRIVTTLEEFGFWSFGINRWPAKLCHHQLLLLLALPTQIVWVSSQDTYVYANTSIQFVIGSLMRKSYSSSELVEVMATRPFDLDKEELHDVSLLGIEQNPECLCEMTGDAQQQHLEHCTLRLASPHRPSAVFTDDSQSQRPSLDGNASDQNSADLNEDSENARRHKHRESMARLREKMRSSIANLQLQERQLQRNLRRTMAAYGRRSQAPSGRQAELQATYFALVEEQKSLESERHNLEDTEARQSKYERLVRRELERLYQRGPDNQEDPGDPRDSE